MVTDSSLNDLSILETLPAADVIRQRLAKVLREAQLLRRLLALAEKVEQNKGRSHKEARR